MSDTETHHQLKGFLRNHTAWWIGSAFVIALSLALAGVMVLYLDTLPLNVPVGSIAQHDIKADQNYEIADVNATAKLKEEAATGVMPVYEFDANMTANHDKKIRESFTEARHALETGSTEGRSQVLPDEDKLRENFQVALGVALKDSDYKTLRGRDFDAEIETALAALLEPVEKRPIIDDKGEILARGELGIVLRTLVETEDAPREVNTSEYGAILSRKEAQEVYAERETRDIQNQLNLDFIGIDAVKSALELYPQFIKTNLAYNAVETDLRRDRASANIQDITHKLQKGQIIVRSGERYDSWHITVLEGMRKARLRTNVPARFAGVFTLAITVLLVIYRFGARHVHLFHPSRKDLLFLSLTLAVAMVMVRMASWMSTGLKDEIPFVDITTLYYLFPVAAGAMLVRFILNGETAMLFAVVLSVFAGVFLESRLGIALYYLVGSLASAHWIGGVERRSAIFRCGLYLGLVNAVMALCFGVIGEMTAAGAPADTLWWDALFAFTGGLLSALVMLAVSPMAEALFNYTTNIQLLELANMNHPLLREMIVRAPGTYHHSQIVGILAEAGARAVGANALLARVGSYYHDIGKMKKAQYFIENQKGENPHDRLAPTMSALIIEAHVKDGIDMAREYKLPRVIMDFIPEHQGTKLIGYFYNKAKKLADPALGRIDERDFRYNGPLPQSRESGIVMLSDTIEAAVRSMPEKTPQKIQVTVEKLVNMHFVDGQLNDCDLTLKDLHLLVEAFVKILIGIYHQRVEYPELPQKSHIKIVKDASHEESLHPYHQHPPAPANVEPLFKEQH